MQIQMSLDGSQSREYIQHWFYNLMHAHVTYFQWALVVYIDVMTFTQRCINVDAVPLCLYNVALTSMQRHKRHKVSFHMRQII